MFVMAVEKNKGQHLSTGTVAEEKFLLKESTMTRLNLESGD